MTLLLASFASVAFAQDPADPAQPPAEETLPDITLSEEDQEAVAKAEEEAREAEAALKAYKAKIAKLRKAAKGSKLAELTTRSGRKYKKVTIRSIDDVGLRIMHSSGTGRIKFADLPIRVQKKYGYDAAAAAAQADQEKAAEEAREKATLARLQAEENPDKLATTRPTPTKPSTTRPATTRPSTTRPSTTRPSTTRPNEGESKEPETEVAGVDDSDEIKALLAENRSLVASIPKLEEGYKVLFERAKKLEDALFRNNKATPAQKAAAEESFEKADVEYGKIREAKAKIRANDRKVTKLRKALAKKSK